MFGGGVEGLVTSYNDNYGKSIRAGKDFAVPTFEEYADFTINHIKGQTESAAVQVVQPTQIANKWYRDATGTALTSVNMEYRGNDMRYVSIPIVGKGLQSWANLGKTAFDNKTGVPVSISQVKGGTIVGVAVVKDATGAEHVGYHIVSNDKVKYDKSGEPIGRYTDMNQGWFVMASGSGNNVEKYLNDNNMYIDFNTTEDITQDFGVVPGAHTDEDVRGGDGRRLKTNQSTQQQVNDWNNQWNALPPGGTLVGLDGKTYTKQ